MTEFNVGALKLSTEICIDYSIGQKVFAYLEKTLTNDEEIAAFVTHAGECKFCMSTMVRWHYDSIVAARRNEETETIENYAFIPPGFSIQSFSEDFSEIKEFDDFEESEIMNSFDNSKPRNKFFRHFETDNEICH